MRKAVAQIRKKIMQTKFVTKYPSQNSIQNSSLKHCILKNKNILNKMTF